MHRAHCTFAHTLHVCRHKRNNTTYNLMFVDREASHNSYLKDAAACWTPGRIDFAATNGHVRRTLEQLRAKINAAILELSSCEP